MDSSFEEWVAADGRALKRAAFLLCRDEHEADDLVQETLVRVFSKWSRVSGFDGPGAYARRTLTNLYLSRWRRLRTERRNGHLFVHPDQVPDGTTALIDRAQLTSLLQRLGPKQRAAVVLHYYLDMPIHEVAAALNCRESTVRAQVSRALAAMRHPATDTGDDGRIREGNGERHAPTP